MTGTFTISSILFLLATFLSYAETETQWSTERNAEEEEENKQVLFRNESLRSSTLSPEEDVSVGPTSLDRLIALNGNVLWNRNTNISDYDELHQESKHDASPENSVDRDPLDNVNYFLQENPVTEPSINLEGPDDTSLIESSNQMEIKDLSSSIESSIHLDVSQESSSTPSKLFLLNNGTVSSIISASDQSVRATVTSFNCSFNDYKCKSSQFLRSEELESKSQEKSLPTSSPFTSLPLWNVMKSLSSQDQPTTESSDIFSKMTTTPNYFPLSVSPSESSNAWTSENIILIDETNVGKDESGLEIQPNKSEKFKPVKHDVNLEELSDELTFSKNVTTPMTPHFKETILVPDSHSLTSTLFRILSEITSTPSTDLFSVESSIMPKESDLTKTVSYQPPVSTYVSQGTETPVDYAKIVIELTNASSPFVYDTKDENKPTKVLVVSVPESTPVLSSSFSQESPPSTEIESLEPIFSSFLEPSEISSRVVSIASAESSTPVLETELSSQLGAKDVTTLTMPKDEIVPPPRITNPSCSSLPVCVEITLLETTWENFCSQTYEFREFLSKSVSHYTRPVFPHHIVLDAEICSKSSSIRPLQTSPDITVSFYVTSDSGEYEERLTELCGVILRKWAPTAFRSSVIEVRLYNSEIQSTPSPLIPELNSGFVAAVSISAVAGVALCLLCILLVIMKQKLLQGRNSDTATPTADAYSLDSLSINASFRRRRNRRSARSYLNHAFNDQEIPSHPLNEKTLANCLKSRDLLEEEFKKIPMNMPKLDSIPEGAHVKNRYSNILPNQETRVVIAEPSGDPLKGYINANFIKGYEGKSAFYIACQAPLPEGIEDFWRMVWEQQCRVVIMLTMFEENGTTRCAVYFPQSTLVSQQPYGDFQVSLLKKDVYEFYTISTLRLLDLEKNLFRDIVHLWFTGWPDVGVPKDPSSLVTFVQQCRSFVNCNSGPTVVHCSTGTGRTGVFLALDICTREYDESRSMDILQSVSQLRRDRGGAVQNKDQYILIYEAMLEYISRVANQSHCPSICSKTS